MNSIEILFDKIEIIRQYKFIQTLLFNKEINEYRTYFIKLGLSSILVILGFIVGGIIHTFIPAIILLISWLVFLCIYLLKYSKLKTSKKSFEKVLDFYEKEGKYKKTIIQFDNEHFKIAYAEDAKTELKWNYFNAYLFEDNTIYLFPEMFSEYISFSEKQIGNENINGIKKIVESKINKLKY